MASLTIHGVVYFLRLAHGFALLLAKNFCDGVSPSYHAIANTRFSPGVS